MGVYIRIYGEKEQEEKNEKLLGWQADAGMRQDTGDITVYMQSAYGKEERKEEGKE